MGDWPFWMIMKIKSNVLFGLIVVIFLISGFSLLKRLTRDVDEWRPSDLYSTTNVSRRSTYSVVSSGASASYSGAMPSVSSGASSVFRHRGVSSYAPVVSAHNSLANSQYPIGGTPSNSVASPMYATSSAEFRSFGGGGNAGGVSMSGGSVKSSGSSVATASGLSISMPNASMYAFAGQGANNIPVVSGDIAMVSTQAYAGIGNTTGGASRRISGRKDAPPSYGEDGNPNDNQNGDESGWGSTWLNWLDNIYGETGDRAFTWYELEGLYEQWRAAYVENNPGAIPPTIEEWMAWFYGTSGDLTHIGGSGSEYTFLPIGDIIPILVMALMYIGVIAVRRYRKSQLNIEN